MNLVADRVKHVGILASTALLPKSLRIPARFKLLSNFQIAKARRADVVIIVHPKGGGTWLRVMVSRLYQMKYGLPPRRVVKTDEFYNRNPSLPRFLVTNGHYSYEGTLEKSLQSQEWESEFPQKKVVLFTRHPCDIAVSWYLQYTKRTKPYKRELIAHELKHPIRREDISMWEFVMHPELGLPGLIAYFNTWERLLSKLDNKLIIRYEDLRAKPSETLKQLMSFIGESCTDDAIEEAVKFASFDNMRELEKSNYFSNSGLTLRNPNDPDTYKVRRGKVGGYKDYFTEEQVTQMEDMVRTRLSPTFGY